MTVGYSFHLPCKKQHIAVQSCYADCNTQRVKHNFDLYRRPVKSFEEFEYKVGSWRLPQRVMLKAEYTAKGELNVRFIVTNIRNTTMQDLYEKSYCGRGCDELLLRQFKKGVNGDRLSCHTFLANRLRIFIYAAANILMHTIREKLMHYAVSIRIHKKQTCVDFAKRNPMNAELAHAFHYYSTRNSS